MSNQIQSYEQQNRAVSIFTSESAFVYAQRMANFLSQSDLVPAQFRGDKKGLANCMIALELANRMNASPFQVMQNIHIIEGRPSFSAKFMAAMLTSNGYSLEYELVNNGAKKIDIEAWVGPKGAKERKVISKDIIDLGCRVIGTYQGKAMTGPWVTLEMAYKEGWFEKPGSKWKTMPEIMIRYRAVSFFANTFAPDLAMGMRTQEEVEDILPSFPDTDAVFEELESDPMPDPVADKPEPEEGGEPEEGEELI